MRKAVREALQVLMALMVFMPLFAYGVTGDGTDDTSRIRDSEDASSEVALTAYSSDKVLGIEIGSKIVSGVTVTLYESPSTLKGDKGPEESDYVPQAFNVVMSKGTAGWPAKNKTSVSLYVLGVSEVEMKPSGGHFRCRVNLKSNKKYTLVVRFKSGKHSGFAKFVYTTHKA